MSIAHTWFGRAIFGWMDVELLGKLCHRSIALDGGKRHLRFEGRFRRARLLMFSPNLRAPSCSTSGRNST